MIVLRDRRTLFQTSSRSAWAAVGQGASALTNLIVGSAVARESSPSAFGVFSIGFTVYVVAVGLLRAAVFEPGIVRRTASVAGRPQVSDHIVAAAGIVGFVVALVLLGGSFVAGHAELLLPLAIAMPFALAQDACRFTFYGQGRFAAAAMNDLTWLAIQVAVLAVAVVTGVASASVAAVAWGLGALVGAVIGWRQLHVRPRVRVLSQWLAENGTTAMAFSADFVLMTGASYLTFAVIGIVDDVSAVGALRGAQVVLAPAFTLIFAARAVGLPMLVNVRDDTRTVSLRAVLLSLAVAGASLTWGACVLLVPDRLGAQILGPTWPGTQTVLGWSIVAMIGSSLIAGPVLALRALDCGGPTVRARATVAAVSATSGCIGSALLGLEGAAGGLAVGSTVGVAVWWSTFSRVVGPRRVEPASLIGVER